MKSMILALLIGGALSVASADPTPAPTPTPTPTPTPAPTAVTQYYFASARRYSLNFATGVTPGIVTIQNVLMMKVMDPVASTITEVACINGPALPDTVSAVYMQVAGNKITAISDTPDFTHPKYLTGTGTLVGPAWNWTQLNFSMTYATCTAAKCATQINETNFVINTTDPNNNNAPINQLLGRKQLFAYDGTPLELYDLEMQLIPLNAFNADSASMGCPAGWNTTSVSPAPPPSTKN